MRCFVVVQERGEGVCVTELEIRFDLLLCGCGCVNFFFPSRFKVRSSKTRKRGRVMSLHRAESLELCPPCDVTQF